MKKYLIILMALGLVTSACSKLTRVLKNPNIDEKYEAAIQFYEDEDYYRASLVFEDLMPNMMGRAEAEFVQFYYAYSQYYQSQYEMAAYYFKQFHDTYRRSTFAEEALYMHAFSLYNSTPDFNLDQSNTDEAIAAMQDFMNRYPQSRFVERAEEVISELRDKLEQKSFSIAKQYQKLNMYKAALVAYENFQRDFPDSDMKEESNFHMIESQFNLANASVLNLKRERYEKTIEMYLEFIDRYPSTAYIRPAQEIFEKSRKELGSLSVSAAAAAAAAN